MTTRPFHHGNLRAVLLEQAEQMLRDTGVDGLSLRELAREAGVSHGAPRSHFVDRQALLDALAERGFDRMTASVRAAAAQHANFEERFRGVGRAYVDFAVDDAALMELMFSAKTNDPPEPVQQAAARLFAMFDELLESPTDESALRLKLLFAATMQGTATLMAARRVSREQGAEIVDDAVDMLLRSELGARVLPR
jgi:AcrR family transcriptional regulator